MSVEQVLFLDLDGVVVKQGTQEEFRPGVFQDVRQLCRRHDVYFFSCWAFDQKARDFLYREFPGAKGFIQKPYAERSYAFIDDKLNLIDCAKKV